MTEIHSNWQRTISQNQSHYSSVVERIIGNDEVESSILSSGTIFMAIVLLSS